MAWYLIGVIVHAVIVARVAIRGSKIAWHRAAFAVVLWPAMWAMILLNLTFRVRR